MAVTVALVPPKILVLGYRSQSSLATIAYLMCTVPLAAERCAVRHSLLNVAQFAMVSEMIELRVLKGQATDVEVSHCHGSMFAVGE